MTGLNLESYLHLLRADVGAWVSLGVIVLLLALMTWTSWGSRRALRKCLVLSVVAHIGLVLYGSTLPLVMLALQPKKKAAPEKDRIQQIRIVPVADGRRPGSPGTKGKPGQLSEMLDKPHDAVTVAESKVESPRPELDTPAAHPDSAPEPPPMVVPESKPPVASGPEPVLTAARPDPAPPPAEAAPSSPDEIALPVVAGPSDPDAGTSPLDRLPARRPIDRAPRPDLRSGAGRRRPGDLALAPPATVPALDLPAPSAGTLSIAPGAVAESDAPTGADAAPGDPEAAGVADRVVQQPAALPPSEPDATDVRRRLRPRRVAADDGRTAAGRRKEALDALALNRATPSGLPRLPEIQGAIGGRPLADVPEVYRSRLDPNRTVLAQRAGATPASEQAVERALAWLARHQDQSGCWDAGTAHEPDGTPVKGDDDFTVHCPPGDVCSGECLYWEADTALTGLALLAYLGSGYTHVDGKYTDTLERGLNYLISVQKPDGDLRGRSRTVGMYCHAMATLALCEAYALTGDVRLRGPVEKAVGFISRSRARDGLAWRYSPGAAQGDTSILGWVVMALKSAKVAGVAVPQTLQTGSLGWLGKVASGSHRGLASYLPGQAPTPTMTAEAWVCRQFLGVGGPGPMSDESARNLLDHLPAREGYNLYYWYYGTLAMYQHGGPDWVRWNEQVRDQLVRRQRLDGHKIGSWDPDDSEYGARGGRIYCTALATLSLEVYYRFLRLYDTPDPSAAPPPPAGRFTRAPARDPS